MIVGGGGVLGNTVTKARLPRNTLPQYSPSSCSSYNGIAIINLYVWYTLYIYIVVSLYLLCQSVKGTKTMLATPMAVIVLFRFVAKLFL